MCVCVYVIYVDDAHIIYIFRHAPEVHHHLHVYIYVCLYVFMYVSMYVCIHVCMYVCMNVWLCVCVLRMFAIYVDETHHIVCVYESVCVCMSV